MYEVIFSKILSGQLYTLQNHIPIKIVVFAVCAKLRTNMHVRTKTCKKFIKLLLREVMTIAPGIGLILPANQIVMLLKF